MPDATEPIVAVLRDDPDAAVRRKAWRVVRSRVSSELGDQAAQLEATRWLAEQDAGSTSQEAIAWLASV